MPLKFISQNPLKLELVLSFNIQSDYGGISSVIDEKYRYQVVHLNKTLLHCIKDRWPYNNLSQQ